MSDPRQDGGTSLSLTEEDLGVDPVDAQTTSPAPAAVDGAPLSENSEKKKVRRTVRIPDDEVARPSRPPPAVASVSVSQPILGQRIIAIGAPLPSPSSPPPAMSAPVDLPPTRNTHPSIVDQDEPVSAPPATEPRAPSVPPPAPRAQEDDSWTPYQPMVVPMAAQAEPPPASVSPRLVSPLVDAPAAALPPVSLGAPHAPPPSQRRPSVQFEAPPAWARPPGARPPADSRPSFDPPVAPATVVDLATPAPGQPWAPPRDSMVDVAVDFESDVTVLDVHASARAAVAEAEAPIHARPTRLDESELGTSLPTGYVAEPSDLSSSHLEMEAASGADLDGGPASLEEVEIDPDSDARPSGDLLAEDLTEAVESIEPPVVSAAAPPPPPKVESKPGEKGAPPAPRLPSPNLLTLGNLGNLAPMPLTDAASQRKKGKPWWEELFNDDFVRTGAKGVKEDYKSEVDFIEDSLGMEKGAQILDLACGTGRHAIELSKRGYRMVGFDLSLAMLARAADLAQAEDQRINFVQGDMREMQFEEAFDGVYSWNTSFGYFEEDKNAQVAGLVHKALRKGGQFLLDIVNRDYIIQESPTTAWFEGDACICMDEMHIDWITSRMKVKRTIMFDDGRSRELEYSVRLYSLHELGRLLHEQGFRVTEVSGLLSTPGVFFGCQSPRTLILAEKR